MKKIIKIFPKFRFCFLANGRLECSILKGGIDKYFFLLYVLSEVTARKHLILNFFDCSKEPLAEMELFYKTLCELPEIIGMKKMTLPYIVVGNSIPGITGVVLIETSHISFHSFSEEGTLYIDVFSCIDFDKEKVVKYLENIFHPKRIETHYINGEFPPNDYRLGDCLALRAF